MGLPLIATPILAGVFGPRLAVAIVTIPILVSNSLLLIQGFRRRDLLRGIVPLFVASIIGTAIGTLLLASLDQRTFAILITAIVVVFLARGDRLLGDDPAALRARILGPFDLLRRWRAAGNDVDREPARRLLLPQRSSERRGLRLHARRDLRGERDRPGDRLLGARPVHAGGRRARAARSRARRCSRSRPASRSAAGSIRSGSGSSSSC